MISVPARVKAAYGLVHQPRCRVTFYHPNGTTSATLPVVDGTLTHDVGQWPNITAQITIQTGSVTPAALPSALTPYGGWAVIELGATVPDSGAPVTDYWTQATLKVLGVQTDYPAGTLTVDLADVSAKISARGFDTPYKSTSAMTTSAMVTAMVGGDATIINNLGALDRTVPTGHEADGDVWVAITDLMRAAGAHARIDTLGRIVLEAMPQLSTTTSAQAFTFGTRGQMTGYSTRLQWGPNRCVIRFTDPAWRAPTGSGPQDAPITLGVWEDTTTGSPTHLTGYYGRHTLVMARNVKVTQAEADSAASVMGRRVRGRVAVTTIQAVPAPWVEPGDTITVDQLDKTRRRHLVASVTLPLSGTEPMSIVTREDVPNLTTAL